MLVQVFFVGLSVWICWEFVLFTRALRSDAAVSLSQRPPGVEGFLPISSLMELWLFLKSGIAPHIHPAGVVIISFAIGTALLLRRGFCSWLCPVGTISEFFTRVGVKLGVSLRPYKWIDIPLRSLKYLLLAFFLYAILGMSTAALYGFITGDYNRVSDIKMLDFFAHPDRMTFSVLGILALLTLLIKNFWCRYLCPYGALLGLLSRLSPMAITRNTDTCIDCDKCDKVCPSFLPVATSKSVRSEECLACHQCTEICPVADCLQFTTPKKRLNLTPVYYGAVFVLLFLGIFGIAKISGYWQGKTAIEEYRELSKISESLSHPRSLDGY
ncbi:4Fe-4S binding protein [candidate division KSB1 bacterium]